MMNNHKNPKAWHVVAVAVAGLVAWWLILDTLAGAI